MPPEILGPAVPTSGALPRGPFTLSGALKPATSIAAGDTAHEHIPFNNACHARIRAKVSGGAATLSLTPTRPGDPNSAGYVETDVPVTVALADGVESLLDLDLAGEAFGTLSIGATGGVAVAVEHVDVYLTVRTGAVRAAITSLPGGEVHLGEVSAGRDAIAIQPTVDIAGAHQAGDAVFAAAPLSGAFRAAATGVSRIDSVLVKDNANQKAPLTLLFFDTDPGAAFTANAPCPDLTALLATIVAKVNVAAADYETVGTVAVAHLGNLGRVVHAGASSNLYVVAITTGTPTYVAASDLFLAVGLTRD